jgi:transcriptional regulator with XRE-family HTH domain
MNLGDKLRTSRKAKGFSLKLLSEKMNGAISISFLSDIENHRSNCSIEKLKLIAKALETPVSYFVDDAENSLFGEAIEDTDFTPIVELLSDFKDWNSEDKKELIYYLKAKRVIRNDK